MGANNRVTSWPRSLRLRLGSRWTIWSFLAWLTMIALLTGLMGIDRKWSLLAAIAFVPSTCVYALHRIFRLTMSNAFWVLIILSIVLPIGFFRLLPTLFTLDTGEPVRAIESLVLTPFIAWFGLSWALVYSIWNCFLFYFIHLVWGGIIELVKRRRQSRRLARR